MPDKSHPATAEGQEDRSYEDHERRGFLRAASGVTMAAGLIAGYGAFSAAAGRYLYPSRGTEKTWLFVKVVNDFPLKSSVSYKTPTGATVSIVRREEAPVAESFLALSSTCPHLGCQVHWEGPKNRFFCPCHNGAFDQDGIAISGPPADAGQRLESYPLKVDKGLLFIEAPTESLVETIDEGAIRGPGHDPCLRERPRGRKA